MVVTYAEARIGYLLTFGVPMPNDITYKDAAEAVFNKLGADKFQEFLNSSALRTAIDDYIHGRNEFAITVG